MRQFRHWWLAAVLALTAWAPAPACQTPESSRSAAVATADTVLAIQTFQFRPKMVEIATGTRVTWTNSDEIEHTVTSGDGETADGRFNGVIDGKGKSFSFTFTQPGRFTYYCDRHHFMRGEIRVK